MVEKNSVCKKCFSPLTEYQKDFCSDVCKYNEQKKDARGGKRVKYSSKIPFEECKHCELPVVLRGLKFCSNDCYYKYYENKARLMSTPINSNEE